MESSYVYKPLKFFAATFLVTWLAWFGAAWQGFHGGGEALIGTLMLVGLLGPLAAALFCVFSSRSEGLKRDFRNKLTNIKLIKPFFLPVIFLLMPLVIVISILLSLPFGGSLLQLQLTSQFRIMDGSPLLSLIVPILAPALEELGWSGYGIDSLRSKFVMLKATLLFGAIWALWHLPLFFIKGYYHYNLLDENIVYAVNFFISVIPMTVVTNWLYFKNERSIIAAMVFHVVVVVSSEMFLVTNDTKCIVTLVLSVFSLALVLRDKKFFFDGVADNRQC